MSLHYHLKIDLRPHDYCNKPVWEILEVTLCGFWKVPLLIHPLLLSCTDVVSASC